MSRDAGLPAHEVEPPRLGESLQSLAWSNAGWRIGGPLTLLLLLLGLGSLFVDHFSTTDNLVAVLQSQAFIGIAAVGMTFVVLSGNFVDLSVPATIAIAANLTLLLWDRSPALALAAGFGAPLLVGLVNGILVGRLRVNPVIATLGVAAATGGILYRITNANTSQPSSSTLHDIGTSRLAGIPVAVIVFGGLLLLAQTVLAGTRFGAYLRLVGANRLAARASGVPTGVVVGACFVACAGLAGITGVLLGAFAGAADLTNGFGYEFEALAAVVIGGTSLLGGVGSFWRTLVGLLVIGVATNLMLLLDLNTPAQLFAKGGILILAVALDALATWGRAR